MACGGSDVSTKRVRNCCLPSCVTSELGRNADLAESLQAFGELERDACNVDAALAHFQEGRERFAAAFSPSHPALSRFAPRMGDVHERGEDWTLARTLDERGLAGWHSIAAYDPAAEGEARAGLGRVLLQLGQGDAGRSELERALVLLTRAHGDTSAKVQAVRALLDRSWSGPLVWPKPKSQAAQWGGLPWV